MQVKVCESCGSPVKKLKHSILCQCGPKILPAAHSGKSKN